MLKSYSSGFSCDGSFRADIVLRRRAFFDVAEGAMFAEPFPVVRGDDNQRANKNPLAL